MILPVAKRYIRNMGPTPLIFRVDFEAADVGREGVRQLLDRSVLLEAEGTINLRWEDWSAIELARSFDLSAVCWTASEDDSPARFAITLWVTGEESPRLLAHLDRMKWVEFSIPSVCHADPGWASAHSALLTGAEALWEVSQLFVAATINSNLDCVDEFLWSCCVVLEEAATVETDDELKMAMRAATRVLLGLLLGQSTGTLVEQAVSGDPQLANRLSRVLYDASDAV